MHPRKYLSGISLIELLFALLISSFLMTSVIKLYLISQHAHQIENAFHAIADNQRIVAAKLTQEIRMAGFRSCGPWSPQCTAQKEEINSKIKIHSSLHAGVKPNTAALMISYENAQNDFFIADTGRKNFQDQPIYGLYKTTIHQDTTELAEGIDDMQINYDLNEGSQLVGIKILLLFSSVNEVSLHKTGYIYVALREA